MHWAGLPNVSLAVVGRGKSETRKKLEIIVVVCKVQ
jgi:hypothetical protein